MTGAAKSAAAPYFPRRRRKAPRFAPLTDTRKRIVQRSFVSANRSMVGCLQRSVRPVFVPVLATAHGVRLLLWGYCGAARFRFGSSLVFSWGCSSCCSSGFLLLFFGRLGRCFSSGCSSAAGSALFSPRSAVGSALSPSRFSRLCSACGGRFSPGFVGSCSFGFLVRRLSCRRAALGSFRCRRRRRSSRCAVGGRRAGSACLPRLFPAGCGWSVPVPSFRLSSVAVPAFCCSRGSAFRAFVAAAAGFRCFRRLSAALQRKSQYKGDIKNGKQELL